MFPPTEKWSILGQDKLVNKWDILTHLGQSTSSGLSSRWETHFEAQWGKKTMNRSKVVIFSSSLRNFFWFQVFHFPARALSRWDVSHSRFNWRSPVVISGTVPQCWPLGNLTCSGCLLNTDKVFFSSGSPQKRRVESIILKPGLKWLESFTGLISLPHYFFTECSDSLIAIWFALAVFCFVQVMLSLC